MVKHTSTGSKICRKKILGIIPARGGSKGIPNKNIYSLDSKPLIYYSIQSAKYSSLLTDFIVTTDSDLIKNISISYKAKVPFKRPKSLSGDTALAIPTIKHALKKYEKIKGYQFDYVVMLQPTAPLRLSSDIDKALTKLISSNAESIISVVDVGNYHPIKMKKIIDGKLFDYINSGLENPPRQKLEKIYIVNGAIYACKRETLICKNSFKGDYCLPYVMEDDRSINIDKLSDFYLAEYYLKK